MNRYKQLRKERGLTQRELAKALNVEQTTVSKWENEITIPDVTTLGIISKFFNVSIDYLLGNENEKPKPNTVVLFGRGIGKKEYELTEDELKLLNNLIETIKKQPTDNNKF